LHRSSVVGSTLRGRTSVVIEAHRIDAQGADLGSRIAAQGADLGRRIDALDSRLSARLDELMERMDDHIRRHAG
jgi:hypothetical protein